LYRARFGDVREVAGPGERIPVDAIRYWEDSLAVQGEVIDGKGSYRTEDGKLLLDIHPSDGSSALTLEIAGTVTTAPGFPDERFPGGSFSMPPGEAILAIDRGLRKVADSRSSNRDVARELLAELGQIKTVRDADLAQVDAVLAKAPPAL